MGAKKGLIGTGQWTEPNLGTGERPGEGYIGAEQDSFIGVVDCSGP